MGARWPRKHADQVLLIPVSMSAGILMEGGDQGDRSSPWRGSCGAEEDGGGRAHRAWPEAERVPRAPPVRHAAGRAAPVVRWAAGPRRHVGGDGASGGVLEPGVPPAGA